MPDVVIGNTGEAPLILRHTGVEAKHWVGLNLTPRMAGTRIRWSAGGKIRSKLLTAGGSYLSAHDPRVLPGLGDAKSADWIEVHWPAPDAHVTRLGNVAAERYHQLKK